MGDPQDLRFDEPFRVNGRYRVGFTHQGSSGYVTYPASCEGVGYLHPQGDNGERFPFDVGAG